MNPQQHGQYVSSTMASSSDNLGLSPGYFGDSTAPVPGFATGGATGAAGGAGAHRQYQSGSVFLGRSGEGNAATSAATSPRGVIYSQVSQQAVGGGVTLLDTIPDNAASAATLSSAFQAADRAAGVAPPSANRHYASSNVNLYPFAWFHGALSREQADANMQGAPRGAFLIRLSTTEPGCFAVMRQTADGGPSQAFLVYPAAEGGYRVRLEPENRHYASLMDMLAWYKPRLRVAVSRASAPYVDPILAEYDQRQMQTVMSGTAGPATGPVQGASHRPAATPNSLAKHYQSVAGAAVSGNLTLLNTLPGMTQAAGTYNAHLDNGIAAGSAPMSLMPMFNEAAPPHQQQGQQQQQQQQRSPYGDGAAARAAAGNVTMMNALPKPGYEGQRF